MGTRRRAALLAVPVAASAILGGCAAPRPHGDALAVPAPTHGIEHLRQVVEQDGRTAVIETWDLRPASGCWSSRREVRAVPGTRVDVTVSTVVRDASGTPRRVTFTDGNPDPGAVDAPACAMPGELTEMGLWRSLAVAGGLRAVERRRDAAGRDRTVLEGPPDAVLTGMPTLTGARRVAEVAVAPGAGPMRLVVETGTGRPVEARIPEAVVRPRDGSPAVRAPAMTIRFTLAEEIPADAAARGLFSP